jgi:restriction system protein
VPIPDYQGFMLPVLRAVEDGQTLSMREIAEKVVAAAGLSPEETGQLLPSGTQTIVSNRVQWAKTYLKKAGLIEQPARGKVRISQAGLDLLAKKPVVIDRDTLKRYPTFVTFLSGNSDAEDDTEDVAADKLTTSTPEESIETAIGLLRAKLADDLLERLKAATPGYFERAVIRVLLKMGYGGSRKDAGQILGKPGDEGIDGTIKEDELGLDTIYVQAKKWKDVTVGRKEIQAFVGSMEGFKARKGVFITTSTFSKEAYDYVGKVERRVVLIDGNRLAQLMIDHDVGVATAREYAIKRVDLDFFADESDD